MGQLEGDAATGYEWARDATLRVQGYAYQPVARPCRDGSCSAPVVVYLDSDEVRTVRCRAGHEWTILRRDWDSEARIQLGMERAHLPIHAEVPRLPAAAQALAARALADVDLPTLRVYAIHAQYPGVDSVRGVPPRPGRTYPYPILIGPPGTGKTHLLAAWAAHAVRSGVGLRYLATTEYLRALRDLMNDKEDVAAGYLVRSARTCGVLILDDLGAERASDWSREELGELIDARYRAALPLIAATNIAPEEWDAHLGGRTASRLREMCRAVYVEGRDRREGEPAVPEGELPLGDV